MIDFDELIPYGIDDEEETFSCNCGCANDGADMFDNYDAHNPCDIPDNMHPKKHCCHCQHPYMINAPHILRDKKGSFIGFTWYYGNSVTLEFGFNPQMPFADPDGNRFTFLEYLQGKAIKFSIYNFRMEEIATNIVPAKEEMKRIFIDIDAKLSERLIKGLYYIKVEIFEELLQNDASASEYENHLVLINPSDLILLVK